MNEPVDSENDNKDKRESFEFSFLKLRLKATGINQEEIRKTVIKTWWLPISALFVLASIIIFGTSELCEKLIV